MTRLGADAAAAFHGTNIGMHLDEVDKVKVPVSYHFGGSDPVVPKRYIGSSAGRFLR